MTKIAKLVAVSLMTRVIVDDSATDEEILKIARPRFMNKIVTELGEHIESIEDDTECPYDDKFDDYKESIEIQKKQ